MSNSIVSQAKSLINNWWIFLITGIVFIGAGIITMTYPEESYVMLAIIFSISFIVTGIFEIYFSISNSKTLHNWGWVLALGIVTLLVGILLVQNPDVSLMTLPFYVGFVVLFRSISAISFATDLKRMRILAWGNLAILGVLGVIFSFILLWNPQFAGLSLVVWTAVTLIMLGIITLYFAFQLQKIRSTVKGVEDKVNDFVNSVSQKIDDITDKVEDTFDNLRGRVTDKDNDNTSSTTNS